MIGGHRGHISAIRENTIANYRELLSTGISHIEIDLQLTADGEIVIYHDFDLEPGIPLSGMIRNHTLAKLRENFDIDTLDETLAWCAASQMPAALEIKNRPLDMYEDIPRLEAGIIAALTKHRFFDQSFVFGLDYAALYTLKKQNPRINLGLIVPFVPRDPVKLMEDMSAGVYLSYLENLCPPLVEKLHRRGFIVDGSVVNTEARLRQALLLGVDMLESDYPVEMLNSKALQN
jgi:glycerophosphoryl diester phosphodiesterase